MPPNRVFLTLDEEDAHMYDDVVAVFPEPAPYGEVYVTSPEPIYAEPEIWIDPYAPVYIEPVYDTYAPIYVAPIDDPYAPIYVEPVDELYAPLYVEPVYDQYFPIYVESLYV
jgi:hypothetical protein